MNSPWKLWQCISDKARAQLEQYQWEHYGTKLDVIPGDQEYSGQFFIESLEEIDRLMRQIPRHYRGRK